MRRNKKGGAQISKHNHQAMHFQIARFCNAKFGFKDFAGASSLAYCNGSMRANSWIRAAARSTRHPSMRGAL